MVFSETLEDDVIAVAGFSAEKTGWQAFTGMHNYITRNWWYHNEFFCHDIYSLAYQYKPFFIEMLKSRLSFQLSRIELLIIELSLFNYYSKLRKARQNTIYTLTFVLTIML